MAVPTTMSDLSVTAGSNSPAGSEPVFPLNNDFLQAIEAILRRKDAKGTDLASSATVNIGNSVTGDFIDITGTSTVASFGTIAAGIVRVLRFTGALTITHSANIILPGALNIVTVANDVGVFRSLGGGSWICEGFSGAAQKGQANTFTATNNFSGISSNPFIATTSDDITYNITGSLPALTTGLTIQVIFPNSGNTTISPILTINGGGSAGIFTRGVLGMTLVPRSLLGLQTLVYSTTVGWVATDQTVHNITTALTTDQTMEPGHTFVYSISAATSVLLRVAASAGHLYRITSQISLMTATDLVKLQINASTATTSAEATTTSRATGSSGTSTSFGSQSSSTADLSIGYANAVATMATISCLAAATTAEYVQPYNDGTNYGSIASRTSQSRVVTALTNISAANAMTGQFSIHRVT